MQTEDLSSKAANTGATFPAGNELLKPPALLVDGNRLATMNFGSTSQIGQMTPNHLSLPPSSPLYAALQAAPRVPRRAVEPMPSLNLLLTSSSLVDPSQHRVQLVISAKEGVTLHIPPLHYLGHQLYYDYIYSSYRWLKTALLPLPIPPRITVATTLACLLLSSIEGPYTDVLRSVIAWGRSKPTTLSASSIFGRLKRGVSQFFNDNPIVARYSVLGRLNHSLFPRETPQWLRTSGLLLLTASTALMGVSLLAHWTVKKLLAYTGWMHERRGGRSWKTKLWGALLSCLIRPATRSKGATLPKVYYDVYNYPHVGTQGYQHCLPTLPLPQLGETVAQYMAGMMPMMTNHNHSAHNQVSLKKIRAALVPFLALQAPTLQRVLWLKYYWSPNYVSDWWLDAVYLRDRNPLMIRSNYYGAEYYREPPTSIAEARAAFFINALVLTWISIVSEKLPPVLLSGHVPFCMDQYRRVIGTTRVPGHGSDSLAVDVDNNSGGIYKSMNHHVVVISRGKYYKIDVIVDGVAMSPAQLEPLLLGLQQDEDDSHQIKSCDSYDFNDDTFNSSSSAAVPGERHLGALTAWKRDRWARVREELMLRDPINKHTLSIIESALFVVTFEDEESLKDAGLQQRMCDVANKPTYCPHWQDLTSVGRVLLHGSGYNRWFDKSIYLIVFPNGIVGTGGEHSWGDATTAGHVWESCLAKELYDDPYDADGHIKVSVDQSNALSQRKSSNDLMPSSPTRPRPARRSVEDMTTPVMNSHLMFPKVPVEENYSPHSQRLPLHPSARLLRRIGQAVEAARKDMNELDLRVLVFEHFGKEGIKKCQCSPDGFIQMALQLAWIRDQLDNYNDVSSVADTSQLYLPFVQTYESASTRLYRNGRTETIRVVTEESMAFVRAMMGVEVDYNKYYETQSRLEEDIYSANNDDIKALDRAVRDIIVPHLEQLRAIYNTHYKSCGCTCYNKAYRTALLRAACSQHSHNSGLAMTGHGCDRHLFAMYCVAVGLGDRVPGAAATGSFLRTALAVPWRLSTSQVPAVQAPELWQTIVEKVKAGQQEAGAAASPLAEALRHCRTASELHQRFPRPSGGFGPVAEDGYGVSYVLSGDNRLFFHITCYNSTPPISNNAINYDRRPNDATRFAKHIEDALLDLMALCKD